MVIRDKVHSYLVKIFDFWDNQFPKRIEDSANHWQGVLGGYANTFYHPQFEAKCERKMGRKISKTGVKIEAFRKYQDAYELFAQDIREIVATVGLTDIATVREKEIKEDIRIILDYNLSFIEKRPKTSIAALQELAWLSEFCFPSRWLIEAMQEYEQGGEKCLR